MKASSRNLILPTKHHLDLLVITTRFSRVLSLTLLVIAASLLSPPNAIAQRGLTLWGDVKIDDGGASTGVPLSVTVILYEESGQIWGRQNVSSHGRYRFTGIPQGHYELGVEADNKEIMRERISLILSSDIGIRKDLEFKWTPDATAARSGAAVLSAADMYDRPAANRSRFQKAEEAVRKNDLDQAVTLLKLIVESDQLDFQVWSLLGTVYLSQKKYDDAEKSYAKALEVKPGFYRAAFHLGSLRASQKRFEDAVGPLTSAVEAQPRSAEANLLLGEVYLQLRKGSKAIPYLNEAAELGKIEAHLRLGWLYNAANLKDKAAAEYEALLKKKPDYQDRKKLEEYIFANKKQE